MGSPPRRPARAALVAASLGAAFFAGARLANPAADPAASLTALYNRVHGASTETDVDVTANASNATGLTTVLTTVNASATTVNATVNASSSRDLTYDDFLDIEDVRAFLKMKGIDSDDHSSLFKYVPRKISMAKSEGLMKGTLGDGAAEGYVAYALAYYDGTDNTASYLIVQDMEGNLKTCTPLFGEVLAKKGMTHANTKDMYKGIGLKNYNSTHLLVAFGKESALAGPRGLFNYETGEWIELCEGESNDSHDIQWAYGADALWQADGRSVTKEFSTKDKSTVDEFEMTNVADPNHVQMVDEDKFAIISSRQTDGILRVHAKTGDVVWTLGGEDGDFRIYDLDGNEWKKGTSLWVGQHNAEYVGDDEYCLFDNQEDSAAATLNVSRLLCVQVDVTTMTAKVTFEHLMDAYTPHFGDNDRLPTGNQLGIAWPKVFPVEEQYDVRAVEIVRETGATAWGVDVVGVKCTEAEAGADGSCDRGVDGVGWTAYSIERFYAKPLISNATCDKSAGYVYFDAVNNFKQNNPSAATYAITNPGFSEKPYATGAFDFAVHWRATNVAVDVGTKFTRTTVEVHVFNEWGDEAVLTVEC